MEVIQEASCGAQYLRTKRKLAEESSASYSALPILDRGSVLSVTALVLERLYSDFFWQLHLTSANTRTAYINLFSSTLSSSPTLVFPTQFDMPLKISAENIKIPFRKSLSIAEYIVYYEIVSCRDENHRVDISCFFLKHPAADTVEKRQYTCPMRLGGKFQARKLDNQIQLSA